MRLNLRFKTHTAVLLAAALILAVPGVAQDPQSVGGQQLAGAWTIDLAGAPPSLSVKTTGLFTSDGVVLIQNVVPDMPGTKVIQGTGEWVRSGNRQFDITWIYLIVSTADGSYLGMFKDRAKVRYNDDCTLLEGAFTFEVTLADGSTPFGGTGKFKGTRLRVEPLP